MLRRPRAEESDEDLLKMQKEFLEKKSKEPAAKCVRFKRGLPFWTLFSKFLLLVFLAEVFSQNNFSHSLFGADLFEVGRNDKSISGVFCSFKISVKKIDLESSIFVIRKLQFNQYYGDPVSICLL